MVVMMLFDKYLCCNLQYKSLQPYKKMKWEGLVMFIQYVVTFLGPISLHLSINGPFIETHASQADLRCFHQCEE